MEVELLELEEKYRKLGKTFETIAKALDIENKKKELSLLQEKTYDSSFYADTVTSSKILKKIKCLENDILKTEKVKTSLEEMQVCFDLLKQEKDSSIFHDLVTLIERSEVIMEKIEIDSLLDGEYDENNAILSIHPGAGGTESQDWAEMLYRMYQKWCLKNEYIVEVLDFQVGEEAGIKSVSFLVKGLNAYGYLKSEKGVHRLVRISPFDSGSRRHTSFAAVEVMPELSDEIVLEIRDEDLEVDTYRASGAGGQHVNKTESAIRIKHVPSQIVVTCQTERSQIQNREYAMKMLKSKLYEYEKRKKQQKTDSIKGESLEITWGSQIRSYVFCPYTLVKDHRTGEEIGNVQCVMDGKIDRFLYAYLKYAKENDIM